MRLAPALLLLPLGYSLCASAAEFRAPAYSVTVDNGGIVALADAEGNAFVTRPADETGITLHHVDGDHAGTVTTAVDSGAALETGGFADLPEAKVTTFTRLDADSGDLVLTQDAISPQKGLWGVSFRVANIPAEMNILVPGHSGLRFTQDGPTNGMTFDYPMSWEAQLVVVEGQGRGFYLWAEDEEGLYKRLVVKKTPDGWELTLVGINYAPFDEVTTCRSPRWRLNVYEGDWRVPARRYREWSERHLGPTKVEAQRPAWVKDSRCMVIMGLDIPQMEAVAKRLDPAQTVLYIPGWRKAGYDRDYPAYDEPVEELAPFVRRAHEIGFKVMLHVNYFGVDPLNPLYEQFEPYQVRSPWGEHEKLWWLWTRADPVIKFAYINPAHGKWRELFVQRMAELCHDYDIDALHLDQTLCIWNDHNGLIEGMSMLQGNVALHRELREALPDVALSGEGLNEVTCRYEAFAQRHATGLNHSVGTWSRPLLGMAHPISSYLLRPYTIINGYLGCAPPTNGQLYAAWNEAYQYWGVIPTLKPDTGQIENPGGFSRQFYDEAEFWLRERVDPDLDGPWPPEVACPYRTASGDRVVRTADRRLLWGDREISRTISDVDEIELPGSIPGWRVYDDRRLFGLEKDAWYPYIAEPRDLQAYHVEALPEGFRPSAVTLRGDRAVIRTVQTGGVVARLQEMLGTATCGSRPFDGEPYEVSGTLSGPDGAGFRVDGTGFFAHPPWKATRVNPQTGVTEAGGTGVVFARFRFKLPEDGTLRFTSGVGMAEGAIGEGKTDGVTFGVRAIGDRELSAELHYADADPGELSLDLSPLAGQEIALELTVHPGPERQATFDWARWHAPMVRRDVSAEGEMVVVGPQKWTVALSGTRMERLEAQGNRYRVRTRFPGAVFLLPSAPDAEVTLPLDLVSAPRQVSFISDAGEQLDAPQYANFSPGGGAVGGVARQGVSVHPPSHGMTVADLALKLPEEPAELHATIGIRDGSTSSGVAFVVTANGQEIGRELMLPGGWRDLTCDLSPWAGKPVVVSVITDSAGGYECDWAIWADPVIRVR